MPIFNFADYMRNCYSRSYNFCGDDSCGFCDTDNPDNFGSCTTDSSESHFINPKMDMIADQVRFNAMLRDEEVQKYMAAMSMITSAMSAPEEVPERDRRTLLATALNSISRFYPEFAEAFRQYRAPR